MSKHTPGPWKAVYGTSRKLWVRDSGGFLCFMTEPFRYPNQDGRYAIEILEMEANARLIAAAPDLLEALKDARFALYGNGAGNPKIDAAIAKAEGK